MQAQQFREEFEASKELTTCAFDAAKKPNLYRQPLEVNLLMCMLYKVFSKIEPAIAKRFRLLASLAAKMQSVEFDKGEHIIQTGQKMDKIYLIYSGQVKINAEIKDKEFNVPALQ